MEPFSAVPGTAGASIDFAECRLQPEPLDQLPSVAEMPIPVVAPPTELPYAGQLSDLAKSTPPIELVLVASAALLVLLVYRHRARSGASRGYPTAFSKWAPRVALAVLVLALWPTAFWGSLLIADEMRERGHYLRAVQLLVAVEDAHPTNEWVGRWRRVNPAERLAEAFQVEGVTAALGESDLALAATLASIRRATSPHGVRARSAAYTANGSAALAAGNRELALLWAERAAAVEAGNPVVEEGLAVASAHLASQEVVARRLDSAEAALRRIHRQWRPGVQALLEGLLAREKVRALFSSSAAALEPDDCRTFEASETILEAAWQRSLELQQRPIWLGCHLTAAREAIAMTAKKSDDFTRALAALRRVELLITNSPPTLEMWPEVLWKKGEAELKQELGYDATASLEEALDRWHPETSGNLDQLRIDLANAYLLRAKQDLQAGYFDFAIASAVRANEHSGGAPETLEAVARYRIARADSRLSEGHWQQATTELQDIHLHGVLRREAAMRLRQIAPSISLLQRLERSRSLGPSPSVEGIVPEDTDSNGQADWFHLFSNGQQIGSVALNTPEYQVVFTRPPDYEALWIVLGQNSSEFDQHTRYFNEESAETLLDHDGDRLADFRLTYRDNRLVMQETLSGRVLISFGAAVITGGGDIWGAGPIDPFLEVRKGNRLLLTTDVVRNTRLPVFTQSVSISYRWADRITVTVKDRDLWFHDYVDKYSFTKLPTSGVYITDQGHAALEITVTPTELEEGVTTQLDKPYFHVFTTDSFNLEVEAIASSALQLQTDEELISAVARIAAADVLVSALLPRMTIVGQLLLSLSLGTVVLEPILAASDGPDLMYPVP